ncbi:BMP family lipoprotein [Clostridium sp. DL1XJH146]
MKKTRIIAVLASIAIVASVFAGCGSTNNNAANNEATDNEATDNEAEETPEQVETDVTVGLSTDMGGRGDKSFNDSAIAGLDRIAEDYTIEPAILEASSQDDYATYLTSLAEEHDLVFGVGFLMESSVKETAEQNPDTNFAIIDAVVDLPNVASITFKEQEGSFLMGVIAGKMTKTNEIGFIGGIDMELIQRFEYGFIAGVKSVNPEAAANLMDRTNVRYTGAFDDPQAGQEAAKALYNSGCDVIYHAAGACGTGLIQEAAAEREDGKEVWAIGVDSDQAAIMPESAGAILSSMMKRVDNATYAVTKDLIEGNFKGGEVVTYGLAEDGVGIAPTTSDNTPQEVIDLCEQYKEAIVNGDLVVPATKDELDAFEVVEL